MCARANLSGSLYARSYVTFRSHATQSGRSAVARFLPSATFTSEPERFHRRRLRYDPKRLPRSKESSRSFQASDFSFAIGALRLARVCEHSV